MSYNLIPLVLAKSGNKVRWPVIAPRLGPSLSTPMNIKGIKNPADLLSDDFTGLPYDFVNFIKTDSMRNRRLAKKKLKLLKIVHPAVAAVLHENERVFYVTQGLRVSTMEQLFIGWVIQFYNLYAFVFTSRRILLIHLRDSKHRGSYVGSIDYVDIRSARPTLLGSFRIQFVNGQTMTLARMPRADRRYVRTLMDEVLDPAADRRKDAPGVRNLCPGCFEEVHGFPASCGCCNLSFKRPQTAAMLSMLMPGLGDWYLGSRFLATLELLFMGMLWFVVLAPVPPEAYEGAVEAPEWLFRASQRC